MTGLYSAYDLKGAFKPSVVFWLTQFAGLKYKIPIACVPQTNPLKF